MTEYIIETKNLSFAYYDEEKRTIPVLDDISLKVKKGSFVAVLGHNGSGKSTLAKLLNMVLTAEDGKIDGIINVCGKNINSELSEDEIYEIRKNVGMVHQNPDNQIVASTVEEDVAFGPENLGVEQTELRKRVYDALDSVKMTEYARHAPHRLSGGQKQRVAIAGIIAMKPEVIIFDESTAMLDPLGRAEVMQTIKKLKEDFGITVILITHYMNEAAEADEIFVLNHGKMYLQGTPEDVFSQVPKLRSASLDVPQVTELLWELKESGIPIEKLEIHTDDGAEEIKRLFTV